ncbi:MAG: response regulator [Desulfobacterales bacterium]|nr:response regulator [Desulfobacterales bacterium]
MINAKVLLVDDEKDFTATLAKRLARRGVTVSQAHSGPQALDNLETAPKTEVVVLDVKMPGMGGLETLRQIKAAHPLVEVIMLTGHASIASGISGMKLGAFDYLSKPCNLELLLSKLDEAARRRRQHQEKIMEARLHDIAARRI